MNMIDGLGRTMLHLDLRAYLCRPFVHTWIVHHVVNGLGQPVRSQL